MKNLLITLLMAVISISGSAQCRYQLDEVDKFSGNQKQMLKFSTIGKLDKALMPMKASISKIGDDYHLWLRINMNLGCVSGESFVLVKFTDGELITLPHSGPISCDETPSFITRINDHLEEFKGKHIEAIRIHFDKTIDINITNNFALHDMLTCLQ